ncbi:MAG: hypothetical protein PVG40_06170 [Desulfobacterales bacterium]|jgi:hypothetical protein
MKNNLKSRLPSDRLTQAKILLAGAGVFCLLTLFLVAGIRLLRPDAAAATVCRQFVRQYGVHTIALVPVGQNLRRSDGRLPNVDLRHDPRLPMENPDAGLVFLPRPTRYFSSTKAPEERQTGLSETE